jgi:hypothetical protein
MLLTRGRGGDYIEPSASTLEAVRIQIEKFVWVKELESESGSIDDPKIRPETGALPCRLEEVGFGTERRLQEEGWDLGLGTERRRRDRVFVGGAGDGMKNERLAQ